MTHQQQPSIDIIIVNHNGINDTLECIKSISDAAYPNSKIIIIDNSDSPEQSIQLKKNYPNHEVIRTENNGFGAANNIGIRKSLEDKKDFILLLNNDAVIDASFFNEILWYKHETETGIFTPKMNFYNERDLIWSAGGKISIIKADAVNYNYREPDAAIDTDEFVDFSSGCCMLIRSEVFEKTGLFDENFFLYVEDTEFCKRVTDAGYKIKFVNKALVYHKAGSSVKAKDKAEAVYYNIRNRLYFAKKYYPHKFYLIKVYIYLSVLKLKAGWMLKREKEKIHLADQAFRDFDNNKMGKFEPAD